jgi:hypothetical protein
VFGAVAAELGCVFFDAAAVACFTVGPFAFLFGVCPCFVPLVFEGYVADPFTTGGAAEILHEAVYEGEECAGAA